MFKKIMIFALIFILLSLNIAFSEAIRIDDRNNDEVRELAGPKDVFLDDFTNEKAGTLPPEYRIVSKEFGTVKVEEYEVLLENGKKIVKNCLEVDDNVPDATGNKKFAGVGFKRSMKEIKGKYAFEVRMMFVEETNPYCSMSLYTTSNGKPVTRLGTGSANGITGTVSGIGETASIGTMESGKWYTFRFIVDLTTKLYQMKVSSKEAGVEKIFTDLALAEEGSLAYDSVNGIEFGIQVYDGKIVFDYIKAEKKPTFYDPSKIVFQHPENSILPPLAEAPVNKPLDSQINLCVNGEYLYPATPLYIENGKTMIYIKNYANLFGGEYTSDGKLIINGKEIVFKENSDIAEVDGKEIRTEADAVVKNGKLFIPLRFSAVQSGFSVGWEDEYKAVLLNNR